MSAPKGSVVIDTSVAVKWYVPEPGAESAIAVLDTGQALLAPDLLGAELANVLWKKVRRAELTPQEALHIATSFVQAPPVRLVTSAPYLASALEIAIQYGRTVYDALYVALALDYGARYLTADEHLVHALEATNLANVVWQLGT